jgi:hypothetical protein
MKTFLYFTLVLGMNAFADTASFDWPERGTTVTCGGVVDGQDLKMWVVTKDGLLSGQSVDERFLVYIDLSKTSRVHWVMMNSLSDDDYAKREAILTKLSPEDADQLRKISSTQQTEFYMGMTDGYATWRTNSKAGGVSLSCQEVQIPGATVTE